MNILLLFKNEYWGCKMHLKFKFLLETFFYFHIFTYLCICIRSR